MRARPRGHRSPGQLIGLFGVLLALLVPMLIPARAAAQPAAEGRVAVTVTTLEGAVHMPSVVVELRGTAGGPVVARSLTDAVGQVTFEGVAPGEYTIAASRPGFLDRASPPFTVRAGETTGVLLDTPLAFAPPPVEVRAQSPSATDSVQPVSMSDMLSGPVFESAPLQGDDFQSLLPLLPGVVRDADGRLRIKGGLPTQGALQVSSASLIDPSTGDFDVDLPAQSVQSVEVLANPFAAEYGRFSTSITQIRTRRGGNRWETSVGNLVPRLRSLTRVRSFEPRFSVRGPVRSDRIFLAQDTQFRYVATPVRSLPGEPEIDLRSFDSFTRLDGVLSARHMLVGGLIMFPRQIRRATMNTFRPIAVTPDLTQEGLSGALVDRFALSSGVVIESTLSMRHFEIELTATNRDTMVIGPETQSGGYFNDQERLVTSVQWVEALSHTRELWRGQHVFKVGTDLQLSHYDGATLSRPVEVRRLDGSLAERTEFGPRVEQNVSGTEFAVFVQDRWRLSPRVTVELGLRLDRDAVVERVNWSPRGGVAVSLLPEGRGILRGGVGKFVQRTPLNVDAFPSLEPRRITRFDGAGVALPAVALANRIDGELRTPKANVANLEWDQRFSRRVLLKLAALGRVGEREYVLTPMPGAGELRLSSSGRSRYAEFEATGRYLGGPRRDLTLSYVWSHGRADLNTYDQFYGNFRTPLVRANEFNLTRDRRAPSRAAPRHHRAAVAVGPGAGARAAVRLSLVGGGRVPGFRRRPRPRRTAAHRPHPRLLAGAPVAGAGESLPGRAARLQRAGRLGRTRHPDQHRLAQLRYRVQPGRSLDRLRPGARPLARAHHPRQRVAALQPVPPQRPRRHQRPHRERQADGRPPAQHLADALIQPVVQDGAVDQAQVQRVDRQRLLRERMHQRRAVTDDAAGRGCHRQEQQHGAGAHEELCRAVHPEGRRAEGRHRQARRDVGQEEERHATSRTSSAA
jgi:hypothetical protein